MISTELDWRCCLCSLTSLLLSIYILAIFFLLHVTSYSQFRGLSPSRCRVPGAAFGRDQVPSYQRVFPDGQQASRLSSQHITAQSVAICLMLTSIKRVWFVPFSKLNFDVSILQFFVIIKQETTLSARRFFFFPNFSQFAGALSNRGDGSLFRVRYFESGPLERGQQETQNELNNYFSLFLYS